MEEHEAQQKREELIERARDTKQELDARENEMLRAVASGEDGLDVERYETVQVGEVNVEAKAWLPGKAQDTIQHAYRLAERENLEDAQESIYTMIEGMTVVTEGLEHPHSGAEIADKESIRQFWRGMYDQWGVIGFQKAASKVLEPANEDMEEKANAADGFRQDVERTQPGDYSGDAGR